MKLTLENCYNIIDILDHHLHYTRPEKIHGDSEKGSQFLKDRKYIKSIMVDVNKSALEVVKHAKAVMNKFDIQKFLDDIDVKIQLDTLIKNLHLSEVTIKITWNEFSALTDALIYRIQMDFVNLEDFAKNGIPQKYHEWFIDELRDMRNTRQLMNTIHGQVQEELETRLRWLKNNDSNKNE